MLSKEKMSRINELAAKKKREGLSPEETREQEALRSEYLEVFRKSMKQTIENVTVIDPKGNDVTPQKLKQVKKNKKRH